LAKASLPVVKITPRQARRFAEATGKLAKTDRMDAALLARMGALLQLEARPVHDEAIAKLKQLHIAREALIKDRTAAKNRGKAVSLAVLKRQNAERLKYIERQIATVEAEIECRPWSLCASILISRPNTPNSSALGSPQRSPSPPSCESSSS